jgi:hypothetical protein
MRVFLATTILLGLAMLGYTSVWGGCTGAVAIESR